MGAGCDILTFRSQICEIIWNAQIAYLSWFHVKGPGTPFEFRLSLVPYLLAPLAVWQRALFFFGVTPCRVAP